MARTPTTYFTLHFDTQRAPENEGRPALPEAVATIAEALEVVAALGLPTAWFYLTQWEAYTLDEADDEIVASCALDEAEEAGYATLE